MPKYLFDPNLKPTRTTKALLTVRRSKRKNIDPAIVSAAIMALHKAGVTYAKIRDHLLSSGHTLTEAEALCDACFFPQPTP